MESKALLLCFRADGPYWQDLIYVPAYPNGFTYGKWQFRYRAAWIHENVKTIAQGWIAAGSPPNADAILAVRFMTGALNRFVPLRKIKITHAGLEAGVNHFYFRLGALRDFRDSASLNAAARELPAGEWSVNPDQNSLMFFTTFDEQEIPWCQPDQEGGSWAKLVELIGNETQLPLAPEAKRALYIRFSNPVRNRTSTNPSLLYTDTLRGPIYGACLKEGENYSLTLTHKYATNPKGPTAPKLSFEYTVANDNIELTQPQAEVLGNYQTTPISIAPVQTTASWEDFVIKGRGLPANGKEASETGATELFVLPVPVKVNFSWLYRLRTRWIWSALLFLALIAQGMATYFGDFWGRFLDGKATLFDLFHYKGVWITLVVASALATFAVSAMQNRAKLK